MVVNQHRTARSRVSTYFIKAQRLMTNLRLAYDEKKLDARLKHYSKYKLLIIDELGYIPFDKIESEIFFQLIDRRYEQKSTIITSNISIEKWHTIFDDVVLAQAIVDRLVHHSHIFNINGKSYRLKDLTKEPRVVSFK
ncbi:MAG: ATP-binding protein [Culicoidibacterales bacterium]